MVERICENVVINFIDIFFILYTPEKVTSGIIFIFSLKIFNYKYLFRNHSKIIIWDSSNSLSEEYVRGCLLYKRDSSGFILYSKPSVVTNKPFLNCKDFVHTGSVVLNQATQILFNNICNRENK
jgi:hypothetical protein